jgi:hypothetical protein
MLRDGTSWQLLPSPDLLFHWRHLPGRFILSRRHIARIQLYRNWWILLSPRNERGQRHPLRRWVLLHGRNRARHTVQRGRRLLLPSRNHIPAGCLLHAWFLLHWWGFACQNLLWGCRARLLLSRIHLYVQRCAVSTGVLLYGRQRDRCVVQRAAGIVLSNHDVEFDGHALPSWELL